MTIKTLIKSISVAVCLAASVPLLAMTPLTLTIHNNTNNKMTLINSKLTRMNVKPNFWDTIDPNTFVPYVLQFDDNLTDIIKDSAEVKYSIQCPNGSKDKLTITAQGKVNQLKVISYSIIVDKKVEGIDGDSTEAAHCSKLKNPQSPIAIKDGIAEVVVVPAGAKK